MRAYRVASGRTIEPFGGEVGALYIGVLSLASWQERVCSALGMVVEDVEAPPVIDEEALVFSDHSFFTEMALRHFLADAMAQKGNLRLAMPDSVVQKALAPASDAELIEGGFAFDVFIVQEKVAQLSLEILRDSCKPVVLKSWEIRQRVRLPPAMGQESGVSEVPLSVRYAGHVCHWLHLLRLSQLSIGVELLSRMRTRRFQLLRMRLLGKADPWVLGKKMNFVHPTARVHPSADLEFAVIGEGAVVGAHAHVHRTVVGPGVDIGDHAAVMGCCLAESTQVLRASYFALCASMPRATLANNKAQLSLFGEDVFLTTTATLIDARFSGSIKVRGDQGLVDTGTAFLGVCLGHRVKVGAGVTIQAGRSVANGQVLVGVPGSFLERHGDFPEGTVVTIKDGRPVPVGAD